MYFLKKITKRGTSESGSPSAAPNNLAASETQSVHFIDNCGLFTLSENTPPEEFNFDIVAVHGLTGNWRQTWIHDNGKSWLAAFLPALFPNARVMAYGYNANIFFSMAVTDVKQEAEMFLRYLQNHREHPCEKERPILLIGHSLGGILVKKAVIIAHEQTEVYGQLLNSIKAVVFFAVPHRGAKLANMMTIFSKSVGILGFPINAKHVALLSKESGPLMDISSQFKDRSKALDIVTFIETETYKGHLIVGPNSSRLELMNEQVCGIPESNHRTICKFDSIESPKYEMVWKAIERLLHKYLRIQRENQIPAMLNEHISYNPTKFASRHFTGREEYLQGLTTFFKPRDKYEAPYRREFVLYGIGGARKTQICLRFAEDL